MTQEKGIKSVMANFLKTEKPPAAVKQKTTLMNIRIPEKLRDDYRRLCFNRGTDMTAEILEFIRGELEKA
jgi:hypothetical protein